MFKFQLEQQLELPARRPSTGNAATVLTATVDLRSKEWAWIECGQSPTEAWPPSRSSVTQRHRSRALAGDPLARRGAVATSLRDRQPAVSPAPVVTGSTPAVPSAKEPERRVQISSADPAGAANGP